MIPPIHVCAILKAHCPDSPVLPNPDWIRVKAPGSRAYAETRRILRGNGLHTVCVEANGPNISECWEKNQATFMIMRHSCTGACASCNVKIGLPGPARSRGAAADCQCGREARALDGG